MTGEVAALPASEPWIDEWDAFYVDIWARNAAIGGPAVTRGQFELTYNTAYFTALTVEPGPAFLGQPVISIDDVAGRLTFDATTALTGVGDDQSALLARVRFAPGAADPGVPLGATSGYSQAVANASLALKNVRVDIVSGAGIVRLGPLPASELWPVLYDIDNDRRITFSDFSFFAVGVSAIGGRCRRDLRRRQ